MSGVIEPSPVFHFGHFVLDVDRGMLLGHGTERRLRPKSLTLLQYLVENAERLISRDEIMAAVWPDTFVTEDSIAQCIKEIRRALDDEAQAVLRTVTRRGYRLAIAALRVEPSVRTQTASPALATAEAAGPIPPPPAGRPVVAVLPFENIGADREQVWFANGLSNDLVTDLTHFQDLHVISLVGPASRPPELRKAAPALPETAQYVFGGSVQRAGGRIRISVQLRDAKTDVSLWAKRFDSRLTDLFAVQEDLTNHIAAHVDAQVGREGLRRALRQPPASLDAYDLYLQGRELHLRATRQDTLLAHDLFDRALRLDPGYASAWAWLAYTVLRGSTHFWGHLHGRAAAEHAVVLARRAVALEPDAPVCLTKLGLILMWTNEWDEALETTRAAVQANPSDPDGRFAYASVLAHTGHTTEAEPEFRLALSLNPTHPPTWRGLLGQLMVLAGRFEEALPELRFCAMRAPNYEPCLYALAVASASLGQIDHARAALRPMLQNDPDLTTRGVIERLALRDPAVHARYDSALRACGVPGG